MAEAKTSPPPQKNILPHTPLQYLKGVGPRLSARFEGKNIRTVQDLIYWYPRLYRDQRVVESLSQIQPGDYVTFYGTVAGKRVFHSRWKKGKSLYEMRIHTPAGDITCKYFKLPYRGYFDNLHIDQKIKATGRITFYQNQPELLHPDIYPFQPGEKQEDLLVPVYTEMENISQNKIRKIIHTAFEALKQNPDFLNSDPLPKWLKVQFHLMDQVQALLLSHQPDARLIDDYLKFQAPAQKRLIFDEFFFLQLALLLKKAGLKKEQAWPLSPHSSLRDRLTSELPFRLTRAQQNTLTEIQQDLKQSWPMHRLIQGDVGSGKTIVALLTCLQVVEQGFQCAIMAPTEILAEQHFENTRRWLEPFGVKTCLLTGKTRTKQKRLLLEGLASGATSLCIGTHALIQESVAFKKLALVIIDEQHRFGAAQRDKLQKKGRAVHFLVMTATPIPRSLAMTLYGNLNVSVMDEMPPGRQNIITKKTYSSKRGEVWSFMESQIVQGRQAYVVYPLVEESENIDLKNALQEYQTLKARFAGVKVGLLHGRLSFLEKQEVMQGFSKGHIQVLVSTTVIEVGVDVPNATVMVVEHAERFGLSQLHQLRGRVGRGEHRSYCILMLSGGFSQEAKDRLSIMEQTQDGFKIAEEDLKLRGPGEFLGTRQSGLPEFKLANLIRDGKVLELAKRAAGEVIQKDPHFHLPEHQPLKARMVQLSENLLPG